MKIDAKRLRLYAVTDRAWAGGTEGLLRQVAEAIDGGAGIVQLWPCAGKRAPSASSTTM